MQSGADRNHRVHRVFLLHEEIDQKCAGRFASFIDDSLDFAALANRAAGIVVGKLGTATVDYDELFL